MKIITKFLMQKVFILISGIFLTNSVYASRSIAWLSLGDFRSHFEPCGCDPESDLGGMRRLSNFLSKERAIMPNVNVLSLGQNVSHIEPNENIDALLLRALARLEITAALPGRGEEHFYRKAPQKQSGIPYVLSNLKSRAKVQFQSHPFILKDGTLIFGFYFETASNSWVNGSVSKFLNFVKMIQAKVKPQRTILLVRTDRNRVKTIKNSNLFSEIVSGNYRKYGSIADQVEKDDEALLQVQEGVWMVPLGGQGVLRGGQAVGKKAPSLAELLGKGTSTAEPLFKQEAAESGLFGDKKKQSRVTWLDKESYEFKSDLADLYAEHFKLQRAEYFTRAEKRKKDIKASQYVGSNACAQCHSKAYKTWNETRHAKAYSTLVVDDAQFNPDCVSCHVVGYDEKGGFVSDDLSGHLKNVQCESCHGPRKEHIANPAKHKGIKATSNTCKQCHIGSHSPKFDFNEYWPKIKHGMN